MTRSDVAIVVDGRVFSVTSAPVEYGVILWEPPFGVAVLAGPGCAVGGTYSQDAGFGPAPAAESPLVLRRFLSAGDLTDHRQVNYKTGLLDRLTRVMSEFDPLDWFRGEVRRVRYYTDATLQTLVLTVEVTYARQPNGLVSTVNPSAQPGDQDWFGRITTRTWYREDGTAHPDVKVTVKTYNTLEASTEGSRRRTNVIEVLKLNTLRQLVVTTAADPRRPTTEEVEAATVTAVAYFSKYANDINLFRETGDLAFKALISQDNESFLDSALPAPWKGTIRDEILATLKGIDE